MLPYDGITRTGSEGISHSVTRRPLASCASYWKGILKASEETAVERRRYACYTVQYTLITMLISGEG